MSVYVCKVCGWCYNEAAGIPEMGIAPGTKWENLPDDFRCLTCGVEKTQFEEKTAVNPSGENSSGTDAPAEKNSSGTDAPAKDEKAKTFDTKVTRNFSYGLFVLTARDGDKDNGCIINTAIQAAGKPLRIAISVNKANYTHDMILKTGAFNISILTEKSQFATYQHFGFQSGRDTEKFESVTFRRSGNGIAYLTEEVNGFLSGKVVQTFDLGSHTLFIADVTDGAVLSKDPSVTYAYYFANIKPKPGAETKEKKGWICTICGYIYEGEELPADFICPLCKHPASDFRKL